MSDPSVHAPYFPLGRKCENALPWLSPAGTRHDDNITDDGRALRIEQGWRYEGADDE